MTTERTLMKTLAGALAATCAALTLISACGGGDPTVTITRTAPAPTGAGNFGSFTMPDVRGKNGAVAMDIVLRAGVTRIDWASADPDHSVVLLPSNWRVTKQEPAPGAKVDHLSPVVLTVVKIS